MGVPFRLALLLLTAHPAAAEAPLGWNPNAAELCLTAPYEAAETTPQRLARDLIGAVEDLAPGPDPLLVGLAETKTPVCEEDRPAMARGYYDVTWNLIAIRSDLDFGERLVVLLHELRHLDQYRRGFCPSTDYDRQEAIRFVYMVEADAQAVATYYAWQLRAGGRPDAWTAMTSLKEYTDVAASFEDAVLAGATPEIAVATAFDRWFASPWRVETYRQAACSAYLDRMDEENLLPSYDLLPEGYFDTLCLLPDGTEYVCEMPETNR